MPGSNSADLVLLRHGIAEPRQARQDHPDRPLTAAGRQRTQRVMAALVQRGLRVGSPALESVPSGTANGGTGVGGGARF